MGNFSPLLKLLLGTDKISTRIIRHLNSEKGGRVTFIPLNRLRPPNVAYPDSSDVVPLVKKLKFSTRHSAAFQQVFGRTVVCRDLDVATKVARTNGLDCITLEGDQVSKKGGMTGGFYDHRSSKLKFMDTIRQSMRSIKLKEDTLTDIRANLVEIDQEITKLVGEQQKLEGDQARDKSNFDQTKQDICSANKQRASIVKALEKKEKLLANARNQIDQLRSNIATKKAEM
ncbi:hypothetical protein AQUCO_00300251v1 [Aquilegia coerulea]|uniref:SMC hinge domain-containing protein n=1 Tax=Aquilegia coerulea TaxID=218851 RepID=A0A2G5EXY2_AQUCA|nr:hypothetical protein AQUCO_00300251v1 [Aquilegia coerulea]